MKKLIALPATIATAALLTSGLAVTTASASTQAEVPQPANADGSGFATVDDLAALEDLSAADQEALIAALEAVPDEIVQGGDPEALHEALVAELGEDSAGDVQTMAVPLVILAARAVACLGPAYAALRNITSGNPDVVAASIAGAIAGCVTGGGASVIKQAILANKTVIANGLKAIGLGSLALLLTGDTAQASAAREVEIGPATLPPSLTAA